MAAGRTEQVGSAAAVEAAPGFGVGTEQAGMAAAVAGGFCVGTDRAGSAATTAGSGAAVAPPVLVMSPAPRPTGGNKKPPLLSTPTSGRGDEGEDRAVAEERGASDAVRAAALRMAALGASAEGPAVQRDGDAVQDAAVRKLDFSSI